MTGPELRVKTRLGRRLTLYASSCILLTTILAVASAEERNEDRTNDVRHRVNVSDAISMTKLADPWYWEGGSSSGRVATFSPDRKAFVVVLRKANLENNTNEFSALLWVTDQVFRGAPPQVLFTVESHSNLAAIEQLTWGDDNKTLYFLGEDPHSLHQLYSFNTRTRALKRLTDSSAQVISYSISSGGRKILYSTETSETSLFDARSIQAGLQVSAQTLYEILMDRHYRDPESAPRIDLFFQDEGHAGQVRQLAKDLNVRWTQFHPPRLSPDGTCAVLVTIPDGSLDNWRLFPRSFGEHYVLVDTRTGKTEDLIHAPIGGTAYGTEAAWSADSKSVVVTQTYLPLDNIVQEEREQRIRTSFAVEVRISDGAITKITHEDLELLRWDYKTDELVFQRRSPGTPIGEKVIFRKIHDRWAHMDESTSEINQPEIILQEDLNTPPKLFAADLAKNHTVELLDPNPQFKNMLFGRVEEITWTDREGISYTGGLYYPPDYTLGRRYPIVVQTHGFSPDRFMIDGPWTTAFAAQPLASHGIMVLQMFGFPTAEKSKELEDYMKDVDTPREVDRNVNAIEGAIEYLDKHGLVDLNRVGLIGFSRTCWWVKYALVNSRYHFAAASVTDGVDGGYFQYVTVANQPLAAAMEGANGGDPWHQGMLSWLRRAPAFGVDKVSTPLRIVALSQASVLGEWEWFAAMKRLNKPVDFVVIKDGSHVLQRPWDRRVSQGGNADWFIFWLKGEEDPDPEKADQYSRWRELRKLLEHNQNVSLPN